MPERLMLDSWAMISELLRPARIVSSSSRVDPVAGEPFDLGQHDVEGLLRPIGRGAGIAKHGRAIALAFVTGVDRVAQPAFLADLGEESGRGIAPQDRRGRACPVVVGAVDGRRGIGHGDLDLLRLAEDMVAARAGRPFATRGSGRGFQSPKSRPTVSRRRGQSIAPATPRIAPLGR